MSTEKTEVKKRRGTSIPLLVGFLILGAGGYLFGEKIMTYVFYLQEATLAKSGATAAGVPDGPRPGRPGGESGSTGLPSSGSEPEDSSGSEPATTEPSAPTSTAGAPGGSPDPEAMFAQRDKDGNGKLEGDEIGERMQARLAEVDSDNDKAVSKDEFLTAWRNRQSSGGNTGSGTQRPASDSTPAAEAPQPGQSK